MKNESIHKGHRQRMRAKLARHGARFFDTYELLEMLLYYSIPQHDTNQIAKRLLSRFKSLDGVFSASREELMTVPGVGERTAELILTAAEVTQISEEAVGGTSFRDYTEVGKFFVDYFKEIEDNVVCAAFLDSKMNLIHFSEMCRCDLESAAVRSEPFVIRSLNYGASVCIVAHNHPYGPLFLTLGDMETTKMLRDDLERIGVVLLECYTVFGKEFSGCMSRKNPAFAQAPRIAEFIRSREEALSAER